MVLFDGHCRICTRSVKQLRGLTRPEQTELISFRDDGVLSRFPGLSADRCEKAMQVIRADGAVYEGAEAIVQALRHRPLGKLALAYYVPGLKQLSDALYAYVAKRRFKLGGQSACDEGGTCHLHVR